MLASQLVAEIEARGLVVYSFTGQDFHIHGGCSLAQPRAGGITFWKSTTSPPETILNSLPHNCVLIVHPNVAANISSTHKALIVVDEPRVAFAVALDALVEDTFTGYIDPTAKIDPRSRIADDAFIGPHVLIGNSVIGARSRVEAGAIILDGTTIGTDVVVGSHSVIGRDGFGYVRLPTGNWLHMRHSGGVLVEDSVHIGAFVSVDQGTLDSTVLRSGCRLDSHVHLAHNVEVGRNVIITSGATLAGGVLVEDDVWIGPGSTIMEHLTIGRAATVGIGSTVIKDVEPGSTVLSPTARRMPPEFRD